MEAALESATKATAAAYEPLFELNKGIGEFLQGNKDAAKKSLRNALQEIRAPGTKFDPAEALYVLVLEDEGKKVGFHKDFPIDAAILLNLWRMGDYTRGELESTLTKLYPEKAQAWLAAFVEPQ